MNFCSPYLSLLASCRFAFLKLLSVLVIPHQFRAALLCGDLHIQIYQNTVAYIEIYLVVPILVCTMYYNRGYRIVFRVSRLSMLLLPSNYAVLAIAISTKLPVSHIVSRNFLTGWSLLLELVPSNCYSSRYYDEMKAWSTQFLQPHQGTSRFQSQYLVDAIVSVIVYHMNFPDSGASSGYIWFGKSSNGLNVSSARVLSCQRTFNLMLSSFSIRHTMDVMKPYSDVFSSFLFFGLLWFRFHPCTIDLRFHCVHNFVVHVNTYLFHCLLSCYVFPFASCAVAFLTVVSYASKMRFSALSASFLSAVELCAIELCGFQSHSSAFCAYTLQGIWWYFPRFNLFHIIVYHVVRHCACRGSVLSRRRKSRAFLYHQEESCRTHMDVNFQFSSVVPLHCPIWRCRIHPGHVKSFTLYLLRVIDAVSHMPYLSMVTEHVQVFWLWMKKFQKI